MGIDPEELAELHPVLYHMAAEGSWPSIRRRGLLSTTSLLDLFEMGGDDRAAIEDRHRPESVAIVHADHGRAIVRDQKPLNVKILTRVLEDELTPRDWFRVLNSKVFFWLRRKRLETMMNARAYRDIPKVVLEVSTQELLAHHASHTFLAPMNTGATHPAGHRRGLTTFQRLPDYPFYERKRRGLEPAVELAVAGGVPDLADFVVRVREVRPGFEDVVLWSRK